MPYVTKTRKVTKYRDAYRTQYRNVERDIGYDLLPYCRARFIFFKFEGLRPSTPHFMFFDNQDVTKFVNTSYNLGDRYTVDRKHPWRQWSDQFFKENQFPALYGGPTNASGAVNTDATGKLEGIFFLQFNKNHQYPGGRRMLSAIDISVLNRTDALSFASARYTSVGEVELSATFSESYQQKYSEAYTVQEEYQEWEPDPPHYAGNSNNNNNGHNGWYNIKRPDGTTSNFHSQSEHTAAMANHFEMLSKVPNYSPGPGHITAGLSKPGACFSHDTAFRMADGSVQEISRIKFGDTMYAGGYVYAVIQGDGTTNDWFEYDGIHVTGDHPVFDDGVWKRVKDVTNGKIKRIKGYDTSYTLLNTNHIMVSHNNKWFTDYDEIEWINNEENEQYVIDKLNEQAKDIKGVA